MKTKLLFYVDAQEVEGQVTRRTPSDIEVQITRPYENISMSMHVPYFARPFTDFTTECGDDVAKKLLKNIFEICKYIDANLEELTEQYLMTRSGIDALRPARMNSEKFRESRRSLRTRLKSGMIDNIEYQKRLKTIRKERRSFEMEKMRLWDSFFEECLPYSVPLEMRKDILRILAEHSDRQSGRSL